jgi:hypothetical protein
MVWSVARRETANTEADGIKSGISAFPLSDDAGKAFWTAVGADPSDAATGAAAAAVVVDRIRQPRYPAKRARLIATSHVPPTINRSAFDAFRLLTV